MRVILPALVLSLISANAFATERHLLAESPFANARSDTAQGTSPSLIDPALLKRLISARINEAKRQALQDLIQELGDTVDTVPARDFAASLSSLVVPSSEETTRTQTLANALVRNALSYGVAIAALDGAFGDVGNCKTLGLLATTSYAALAREPRLHGLGFLLADEGIESKCTLVGERINATIGYALRIGADLSEVAKAVSELNANLSALQQCGQPLADAATAVLGMSADSKSLAGLIPILLAPSFQAPEQCATAAKSISGLLTAFRQVTRDLGAVPLSSTITDLATVFRSKHIEQARLLMASFVGGKPNRADFISMLSWVRGLVLCDPGTVSATECTPMSGLGRTIVIGFLDAIPHAIKENPDKSLAFDMPALSSALVSEFFKADREGWYLRGTIGAGYILGAELQGSLYEEIGFGHRWNAGSILHGPHVAVSGLLHEIAGPEELKDTVLGLLGWSINLYGLIDFSASGGLILSEKRNGEAVLVFGLQIPLVDYLSALTEGSPEPNVEERK